MHNKKDKDPSENQDVFVLTPVLYDVSADLSIISWTLSHERSSVLRVHLGDLFQSVDVRLIEPGIKSYGDSLWFCFASATSIGYGDIIATTLIGRIISVVLTVYSIVVIAIFTAVVVGFFNDMAKVRANASVQKFTDDLEHLPELSKEELEDLSKRVKDFLKR